MGLRSTLLAVGCIVGAVAGCGDRGQSPDNASNVAAISGWEDCVGLDHSTAQVKLVNGSYKIVEGPGGRHWAFDFGSNRSEAETALKVIKNYRYKHSCYVGRPGPSFEYQLASGGTAPGADEHAWEDCIAFDPDRVEAKWFPDRNTWKLVQGNMWMVDFGLAQDEVHQALRVIKKYRFNRQCFVGRPDPSFSYWGRKRFRIPPVVLPPRPLSNQ